MTSILIVKKPLNIKHKLLTVQLIIFASGEGPSTPAKHATYQNETDGDDVTIRVLIIYNSSIFKRKITLFLCI